MDANVLNALDKQSGSFRRPSLTNIIIYGRVRCIISKPSFLGDGIEETDGYFALLDAYALKCLGEDYFRNGTIYDVNSIYFTKGSVLIYINKTSWVGKDVKVFGKSKSYGCTIRRQNAGTDTNGISAFMFGAPKKVNGKSVFPLVSNVLTELNSKDPDAKGTALEDFLVSISANKGVIPYPETLDSIIPYTGDDNYTELEIKDIENDNSVNNVKVNDTIEDKVKVNNDIKNSVKNTVVNTKDSSSGRVDVSKIDMKLTYHLQGQDESEYLQPFKEDIEENARLRNDFVSDLVSIAKKIADKYMNILNGIKYSFSSHIVSYYSAKTKKFVEDFFENCNYTDWLGDLNLSLKSESDKAQMRRGIEKLKANARMDTSLLNVSSFEDDVDQDIAMIPLLKDVCAYVINIIGSCTGIGFSTIVNGINYLYRKYDMSHEVSLRLLIRCPYLFALLSVGLSVVDCDLIYYSFSKYAFNKDKDYDADEEEYIEYVNELIDYNIEYRNCLVMLDTLDSCSKGNYGNGMSTGINTFVKIDDYKKAKCSYPQNAIKNINNYSFIAVEQVKNALERLLEISLSLSSDEKKVILNEKWFSKVEFKELCDVGIINTLDDEYCALERNLEQELMIYDIFARMGKKETGISDNTIEKVISAFEESRGFKLEGLQREGIKLCKYRAGVLSGCAGSGKTTTSDCITEVLKTLNTDDNPISIIYCTPTGKACRRLAEVVHSTVKTIHSQFGVGLGGTSYLQSAYVKKTPKQIKGTTIYILDEMAMCNTELMYNIAKNVSEDDIIYFLGDIKQLPPIGGGCPFKVLMSILPCVELGVSKRAAEGSLVNYNTSLINFMSDGVCKELLYDDKTFISRDCNDVEIPNVVKNVFSGFIDGSLNGTKYNEDDIQVITGYRKKEKLSSTVRLNNPLQSLLRSNDKLLYYKTTRVNGSENEPFYNNDRVIYVNRNSYDICRYVYDNGSYNQVITFGCVNGEMGKLIGVISSKAINILPVNLDDIKAGEGYYSEVSEEEFDMLKERYEDKKADLRKDDSFNSDDYYFVVVKVYDSDLKRDVVVLLRGRGKYLDSDLCLSGSDLSNLELAYALTCHKMQGSQSKVVVAVFESTGSPDFLNRNMINTIITRSQGIVCCVGSILGEDSMLNRGRRKVSKVDNRDLLSILSDNANWLEG